MQKKGLITIPIVLTVLIILFGNNWIPRLWDIVFNDNTQVEDIRGESSYVSVDSNNSASAIYEESDVTDDTDRIGLNIFDQIYLDTLTENKETLDVTKDYSIDDLTLLLLDDKLLFVERYLSERSEYLKLLDQKRVKELIKTVSTCREFDLTMAYFETSGNMIITFKDDKYGFLSVNKERIWNEIFESIEPTEINPLTYVSKNGKWGVINADGKIIVPVEYDDYDSYFEDVNFFGMKKHEKLIFFNKKGERIDLPIIEDITRVSGEHMVVETDELKGLINLKGELVLPIRFDSIITNLENIPQYRVYGVGGVKRYSKYVKEISCS